jgi:translocation and assembly module TamB
MAELEADIGWWSGERATLAARIPVEWSTDAVAPSLAEDEDLAISADFESAPLGPFISWMPQIAFAAGHLTGTLDARGKLAELDVRGALELTDGYVEVESLGQHLNDVEGRIALNGNWIELEGIRARDGDGRLRIDGGIGLEGWRPSNVRIAVHGNDFPVRSEGSVLAELTGNAAVEGTIGEDETEVDVTVRSLAVELPDETARTTQELAPHPDIHVVGEEAEVTGDEAYPIIVNVDARNPFWVRRTDFATQVSAQLHVEVRDPDLWLAGSVEIRRGFFEVFGKRFEVNEGQMTFDGGSEIDPRVSLRATHEMRAPAGTEVTVTASGRLSSPEIEFRSNHRECDERAEIIAMLVSNRCGVPTDTATQELDAYEQASSFLAGLAAGVLTLTARKEFGDVLPVIVIESGEHAFQSARIRAGFQADDYIPDFMRGFVRGAYIEGIFTAGGTGTDSSPVPGVRLELSFPASLVLSGEVMPTGSWGADLTWEP